MKSSKELLGERIRELRKGLKMSQEQLSELVDVDPRYISRIELGKCFPSLETLENIARALQVAMRELFDYEHLGEGYSVSDNISGILDSVRDEQQRTMILKVVKAVKRAVLHDV